MSERKQPIEQQIGTEWVTYGEGVGLKTEDLQSYQRVASPRLKVLRGVSIGDSHFKSLLTANNLTIDSDYDFEDELQFPVDLEAINRQVLTSLPKNKPVMVRSSALDERGGSGIYTSDFFITTGNQEEDLNRMRHIEDIVYSDFFTERAMHHREQQPENSDKGMSLLIQPVVGDEHEGHFMPALSGVLTTVNGQPLLRLVMGLGTGAVDMGEAVVLKGGSVNVEKAIDSLWTLRNADAINLNSGELDSLPVDDQMIEAATAQAGKLNILLEEWQQGYDSGSPYYLEFALTESEEKPVILQAAPDEIKPAIPELGMPKGIVICEGTDVVNTGEKAGRGIVWFGKDGQNPDDLALIADFNRNNKDFLLFVRDTAFSRLMGRPLIEMQHFSNAAGVVEVQYVRDEFRMPGILNFSVDHSRSRGGAHFAEICKREDILFLGYTVPKTGNDLEQFLGRSTDRLGHFSAYWDVDFLMANAVSGGRVELMGEVVRPEYSPGELKRWADEFWHLASELGKGETGTLSAAFYGVTYLLADLSRSQVVGYNPFDASELSQKPEEKAEAIRDLQQVLENIDETESAREHEMWGDGEFRLQVYLQKLLATLASE